SRIMKRTRPHRFAKRGHAKAQRRRQCQTLYDIPKIIGGNYMGLKIASWVATIASIAGFFITVYPHGQSLNALQVGLICLTVIFFGYLIYADINDHYKNRQKAFKNDSEINEYMYNWISKGGRVAIFTHDMSWANGQKMKDLLFAKARNNELCICLPKR